MSYGVCPNCHSQGVQEEEPPSADENRTYHNVCLELDLAFQKVKKRMALSLTVLVTLAIWYVAILSLMSGHTLSGILRLGGSLTFLILISIYAKFRWNTLLFHTLLHALIAVLVQPYLMGEYGMYAPLLYIVFPILSVAFLGSKWGSVCGSPLGNHGAHLLCPQLLGLLTFSIGL